MTKTTIAPGRRQMALRYLFALALPMLPLLGYACTGAVPPEFDRPKQITPSHLLPQPRVITGFPAVSSSKDVGRRGPSRFSHKAVKARADAWTVKRLEVPRWRLMMTDHFVIRSDAWIDDLRYAGVYLEEALVLLKRMLGGDTDDVRFSIRIFRSYDEFRVYASCLDVTNATSFYDPKSAELVVYRDRQGPRSAMITALMHEVVHLYLHRIHDITRPLWLTEGLAEVFARYSVATGKLVVGRTDKATVTLLADSLERGEWLPLRDLIRLDRERFYGDDSELAYAQSWLLTHHLLRRRPKVFARCLAGSDLKTKGLKEGLGKYLGQLK